MPTRRRTMIVTGATKGISTGVTNAFIDRVCNVVANALNITPSTLAAIDRPAAVRGHIGNAPTALDIVGAIVYLTEARHATEAVLHVDAGAYNGKW